MSRPVFAALAAASLAVLTACGPDGAGPAPSRVEDAAIDPAPWETSWTKDELDTWREGIVIEPPPGDDLLAEDVVPVAGATVELLLPTPAGRLASLDAVASTTTGADGRFRIGPSPANAWILRVTKPGCVDAWVGGGVGAAVRGVALPPPRAEIRVLARAIHEIAGTLIDETGRPAAGVRVVAAGPAYREEMATDAGGRFLARAPAGMVVVEVEDPRFDAKPTTFAVPSLGTVPSATIRVRNHPPLTGSVETAEGRPVADAVVLCVEDPSIRTRSDANGRFALRVAQRTHVAALTGGYAWHSLPVPRAGEVRIRLRPSAGVEGVVVDEKGAPVPDARLTAVVLDFEGLYERVLGPRTGPDGRFRFAWMPQPPRGVANPARFLVRRRGLGESAVVTPTGSLTDLRVELRGARDLAGTARHADGSPIADALVRATWGHWDGGITPPEVAAIGGEESMLTLTDSAGRWRLPGVPLGLHAKVECTAVGVILEKFVEGPGAPGAYDFVFAAGRSIAGSVVGADGGPAQGQIEVSVELIDAPGVTVRKRSRADPGGGFQFDGLPPGRYQITATGDLYDLAGGFISEPGRDEPVTVKVERSATLEVAFVFEGGRPPDVPLLFTLTQADTATQKIREPIAPGGGGESVKIRGVYPGTYSVELSGDVWRGAIERLVVADGDRREIELPVTRTLRVAAKLSDADGKPLPRQLVVVAPVAPTSGRPQTSMSGDGGALDLTGLAPGRWAASSAPAGAAPLRVEFDVKAEANPLLDLRLPPSGAVAVGVTRDDGTPIADAIVVLTNSDGTVVDAWGEGALALTSRFRTDREGRASIRGVRAGRVRVEVRAGEALLEAVDVDVVAGRETTVEVK